MSGHRCENGRAMRHKPMDDDPYFEVEDGVCQDCDGEGCDVREHKAITRSIGDCEKIADVLTQVDEALDTMFRRLPAAAESFIDRDPCGIDVYPARLGLKILAAHLAGQLARFEDGSQARSPYLRPHPLPGGPDIVLRENTAVHDAWLEGFKTDGERQADAAERQAQQRMAAE